MLKQYALESEKKKKVGIVVSLCDRTVRNGLNKVDLNRKKKKNQH